MIPGEYILAEGDIVANQGRRTIELVVANTGDRPIQVGSHFHFFEVNRALRFDRGSTFGMRLNIPAGTAVRFEPGDEKRVMLVELGGARRVFGLNALTNGGTREAALTRLADWEHGSASRRTSAGPQAGPSEASGEMDRSASRRTSAGPQAGPSEASGEMDRTS